MLIVNARRETDGVASRTAESLIAVERKRIAREVHDRIGNQLACLKLQIQSTATGRSSETLLLAAESLDRLSTSIHEIIHDLRDDDALDQGLAILIGAMVEEWRHQGRHAIEFEARGDFSDVAISTAVATIDCIREAMTNVMKHALGARRVTISLSADAACLRFSVTDDGRGFIVDDAAMTGRRGGARRFGLAGMRERAGELGGDIAISSSPERGTTISGCFPIGGTV